jgi:hypothetical protein
MASNLFLDYIKLVSAIPLVLVCGCSTDRAAQNVYEGIQNRNEGLKTPQEKASEPPPQSYPDYERERKQLKPQ